MSAYSDPFVGIEVERSIDAVSDRTKDWLMRLNVGKCKVMHLGKKNNKTDFEIEDLSRVERRLINKTISEKCEGVSIRADLKWRNHVRSAEAKANRVLGMIKKTFWSKDIEICKELYVWRKPMTFSRFHNFLKNHFFEF